MNEFWDVYFPIAFGILFVGLIFFYYKKKADKVRPFFERQAMKRNGHLKNIPIANFLVLQDFGFDVTVSVAYASRSNPDKTTIECRLPSKLNYNVLVTKKENLTGIPFIGFLYGSRVELGNPMFDEIFLVYGTEETALRNYLDHDIQQRLFKFQDGNLWLEVSQNNFCLSIPRLPQTDEAYDRFIDLGLLLIKKTQII